jgi:hypothetical protein
MVAGNNGTTNKGFTAAKMALRGIRSTLRTTLEAIRFNSLRLAWANAVAPALDGAQTYHKRCSLGKHSTTNTNSLTPVKDSGTVDSSQPLAEAPLSPEHP